MRSRSKDPYLSFRFKVQISGVEVAGFNEVSGLTFETSTESFKEGGFNEHERQLIGPTVSSGKLILKKGLSDDSLWKWYKDVMAGRLVRKGPLTISLFDYVEKKDPKWQWVFLKVCPVKWTGPQFRAGTAEVAFESIELSHRGLKP